MLFCAHSESGAGFARLRLHFDCCRFLTMRRSERFSYRKRSFLMPDSTGVPSYIVAEVESSYDGEYNCGHYMITLADCRRQIQLEFPLTTARSRRQSLSKIDLLLKVLIDFGTALQKEAQLISDSTRQPPNRQSRKRKKTDSEKQP